MTIYTICNPSDDYTMVAELDVVAAAAGLLLGGGQFPIEREPDDEHVLPFMAFMPNAEEWWEKRYGQTVDDSLKEHRAAIADCLDSVLIGDRATFDLAVSHMSPEQVDAFRVEWHDKHRTSMNNIGDYARALAKALREPEAPSHA